VDDEHTPEREARIWNYVEHILLMTQPQREMFLDNVMEMLEATDVANEVLTGEYQEAGH
jgi:hypothetical protein